VLRTKDYSILSKTKQVKWKIAFKGILVGIIAGLLTVLYRIAIEYGTEAAGKVYSYLRNHPTYILVWLIIILVAGTFIGWMVKLEPMAGGSGIPQTEGVVIYGLKMKWYTILAVRYIGGTICSFFGLSVGREGPSIQIGASAVNSG
jgi:H+/Cl- antiporter ClcA